ncbi:MAG: metallophosphoesterase [Oscillospiraceae bacterium]|nr:metallophosphoesterase [Oscillospiraceae bacterium]
MKILVLSDSHGTMSSMERALERERPDCVLHLGDHLRDARSLARRHPQTPVYAVPGNCDLPGPGEALWQLEELGGVRIFMTHGHAYGVKRDLLRLSMAARELDADVAVFGHTHRPFCQASDGLWLMNPGACGQGRSGYGVIEIENGAAVCRLASAD